MNTLHHLQTGNSCRRTDSFCPKCTAYKCFLGSFHNFCLSHDSSNGISISQCFTVNGHVRLHPIYLVKATKSLTETTGTLVKNQDDITFRSQLSYFLQEIIFRPHIPAHLHFYRSQVIVIYNIQQFLEIIISERDRTTS